MTVNLSSLFRSANHSARLVCVDGLQTGLLFRHSPVRLIGTEMFHNRRSFSVRNTRLVYRGLF